MPDLIRQPTSREPARGVDRRLSSETASLVVVSNRLPYDLKSASLKTRGKRNVGGLVNALEPALAIRGGMWVGWDGLTLSSIGALNSALEQPRSARLECGASLHGVPLTERDIALYYNGLCNRALWPLFHDFPGRAVYLPEDWDAYVKVNKRFAEAVARRARRNDRIWVHDYQLMLLPAMLRELGVHGRIDFFLHIPFPPTEIFRALPWRSDILKGLLAADAVVFHVPRYRDNFVDAAAALAGVAIVAPREENRVDLRHADRLTRVAASPIGIDVADFERLAEDPQVGARSRRIRKAFGGRPIVFGAERLDYTKGVLERLLAVERLLRTRPELAGRFVFLQVVVPSRHQVEEYRRMKREIDREVGRINGEFSTDGWQPIHYRFRALDRAELVAHYLAASVALVTPLRDGMNLVAAEFIASRTDGDGVLVLSEFAGIADLLDGPLLVNPNDLAGFAESIFQALAMPLEERHERMSRMRPIVVANPASTWASRCLDMPSEPVAPEAAPPDFVAAWSGFEASPDERG